MRSTIQGACEKSNRQNRKQAVKSSEIFGTLSDEALRREARSNEKEPQ
jgi:hypothetical protein